MAAVVEVGGSARETTDDLRPAFCLLAAPAAVAVVVVAIAHLDHVSVAVWVAAALVVAWAAAGALVGVRRRVERVGPIALAIAGIGALGMLASSYDHRIFVGVALGLLPAAALHLLAARYRWWERYIPIAKATNHSATNGHTAASSDRGWANAPTAAPMA